MPAGFAYEWPQQAPPEGQNYAFFHVVGLAEGSSGNQMRIVNATIALVESGVVGTDPETHPDVLVPTEESGIELLVTDLRILAVYAEFAESEFPDYLGYNLWIHEMNNSDGQHIFRTDIAKLQDLPLMFLTGIVAVGTTDKHGEASFLLDKGRTYVAYIYKEGYRWTSTGVALPEWPAVYSKSVRLEPNEYSTVSQKENMETQENLEGALFWKTYPFGTDFILDSYTDYPIVYTEWVYEAGTPEPINATHRWNYTVATRNWQDTFEAYYTNDGETIYHLQVFYGQHVITSRRMEELVGEVWVPVTDWETYQEEHYPTDFTDTIEIMPEDWQDTLDTALPPP